jgi:membrane associated rhomboid family serine protease
VSRAALPRESATDPITCVIHAVPGMDIRLHTQRVSDISDAGRSRSPQTVPMLPLSDGLPARRFPIVNIGLIVANFAVWIFYELPHLNSSIYHASFYPCAVNNSCHAPEPWGVSWITAMFLHGSWDHILGNMLFLAIFGKNVEDAFGPLRYLAFYFAGGLAATITQTAMTLLFGTRHDALVPNLGASGAIAAVLGAYFILYPTSRVLTLVFIWPIRIPAYVFLGLWFVYQLVEANFGLFAAKANGGGVAFFAHVGGFIFGVLVARILTSAGRVVPQDYGAWARAPA